MRLALKSYVEGKVVVTLAQLVYRISTDPEFATRFRTEPRATLSAVRSTLTEGELVALLHVLDAREGETGSLLESFPNPLWFATQFQN